MEQVAYPPRIKGGRRWPSVAAFLLLVLQARTLVASPNVDLDSPAYEELRHLRIEGRLSALTGGFVPVTEQRVGTLLGERVLPRGWWVRPVERLRLTGTLFDVAARPYSTAVRPRDLSVGSISIACENQQGRPCGDGAGGYGELDTSAGYGDSVSASVRLRAQAGQHFANNVVLDRAYLNAQIGPVAAELGRDVLVFGPSSRTQLGWGNNAAPLTHARISTAEPFRLTNHLHANAVYVVGRLQAPQKYPRGLVSIARVQLDVGKNLELGLMQLLQLGGEGAPHLGLWDFIAEHVRRKDISAGEHDSSNRRFGGDIAFLITELHARLYYSLVFEDIRRARWIDALRYDADHLLGIELGALGPSGRDGLLIEWHETGFRSHEHTARTTGFSHLGLLVGSPLGPDASSLFVGGRLKLRFGDFYPSMGIARLASDTYEQLTKGPITRLEEGVAERRYRGGARVRTELSSGLYLDISSMFERVTNFGFEPGHHRNNLGGSVSIIWFPRLAPLTTGGD